MGDDLIVPFVGRPERTARENLDAFVKHARGLGYFDGRAAVPWNGVTWDLRSVLPSRTHSRTLVLHFNTMETRGMTKRADRVPLAEPFATSVKALVAATIPTRKMSAPFRRLMALRALERAFRDLGRTPDLVLVDHAVLDRAAFDLLGNGRDDAGWVSALADVAEFISDKRLTAVPLSWKNPAPPDREQRRSGKVREDGRSSISEKLPHVKCVLDLASVFENAEHGADAVTTAFFALAMFAPSRISEILTLPLKCETEAGGTYGLSWRPGKGGDPLTKFAVNPDWADVARIAIARLRRLGETARVAATWYDENPDSLYLPPGYEHLRGEGLTEHEVLAILGIGEGGFNKYALSRIVTPSKTTTHDPARTGGRGWTRLYEFGSVERYVLKYVRKSALIADGRFKLHAKDALFCLPRHTMRANYAIHANVPTVIDQGQIYADMNNLVSTIFVRHDFRNPETGMHWKLTTHQPRHLLNTLAQSKHVSQELIAFWSGRKRVDQNSWYDHIPHEAFIELYVALAEKAPRQIEVVGPLADKVAERTRREKIKFGEGLRLELGSGISTRYGFCRHNYALTPCPKDKNCIGCGENTFIKGDARHLAEAERQVALEGRALDNCVAAMTDGEPSVEPWLRKHVEAHVRWSDALSQMRDPSIADGTLITLRPPTNSQTKTGLAMRIAEVESRRSGSASRA